MQPLAKSVNAEKMYAKVFGAEGQALKKVPASELRAILRSFPEDQGKAVILSLYEGWVKPRRARLALMARLRFSPARYLTQYNRMSEPAKKAVFGGIAG